MTNVNLEQWNKQVESLVTGPARAYMTLAVDHAEKLLNVHFEAVRAYTDTGVRQIRAALEIKDPAGLRSYVEQQQKAARDLGERVKDEAEKVVSINQEFVEKARKVTEDNVRSVSETVDKAQGK